MSCSDQPLPPLFRVNCASAVFNPVSGDIELTLCHGGLKSVFGFNSILTASTAGFLESALHKKLQVQAQTKAGLEAKS